MEIPFNRMRNTIGGLRFRENREFMLNLKSCVDIHEGMLSRHLASDIQKRELNRIYKFEHFWHIGDI